MKLFECLELIPDPRKPRGVRHPFPAILCLVMLGFVCRLVAIEHITSYFSPIWSEIGPALGFDSYRHKIPDATTIRRALAGVKVEQLQEAFGTWVSHLLEDTSFSASVDGKAMKNVKSESGGTQMLLNVFAHDIKLALAEYKVDSKEGESTVLKEALQGLFTRYPGLTILVGDAAFSGRELNHAISALGKDYVVQVKKNQPSLQKQIEKWFGKKNEQNPQAVEVKKKH